MERKEMSDHGEPSNTATPSRIAKRMHQNDENEKTPNHQVHIPKKKFAQSCIDLTSLAHLKGRKLRVVEITGEKNFGNVSKNCVNEDYLENFLSKIGARRGDHKKII